MIKESRHNHSFFSDGKNTPEEMVLAAIENKITHLGISDHAPVPFPAHWAMPQEKLAQYISILEQLKEKYASKIRLYSALEVDFLPDEPQRFSNFRRMEAFDYLIGSIHMVDKFSDGTYWDIASSKQSFSKGLEEIFDHNAQKFVERYFELQNTMISEHKPDIIAHLDLITRHNKDDRYWDSQSKWYRNLMYSTLENIAQNNLTLEINTRGLYKKRVNDYFPSKKYFPFIKELGIKTIVSSDAHSIDEINNISLEI